MVLLHLDDGSTQRLDPRRPGDLRFLDSTAAQRRVRRVALVDDGGKRVDLPLNRNGIFRMWMEQIEKGGTLRGERFCMRTRSLLMKATLFYSDSRVVIDLDSSGGF